MGTRVYSALCFYPGSQISFYEAHFSTSGYLSAAFSKKGPLNTRQIDRGFILQS